MAVDTFKLTTGSGLWDDPANWTAGVPQTGSDVVINGATATILASDPTYTVASLTIDTPYYFRYPVLSDNGTLVVTGATTVGSGAITVNGTFTTTTWSGSGLTIESGVGTAVPSVVIGSALATSTLPLGGLTIGAAMVQTRIVLAGTGSVTGTGSFGGLLTNSGVSGGAQIVLPNVPYSAGETISIGPYEYPGSPLTISSATGQPIFTFNDDAATNYIYEPHLSSPVPAGYVDVTVTAYGAGTLVSFAAPSYGYLSPVYCYTAGTAILTDMGERPIEDLRIGDIVTTQAGAQRPIRWIGQRSYVGRFLGGNARVLPIRFRAGCLGGGLPHRDLLVSPDHAMVLENRLIAARSLVNGDSIVQETAVDRVDYYHLELDSHDVIFAEGAASETFVDDGRRGMFQNAADYGLRYPHATAAPLRYCLPRLHDGEGLEAIRRAIAERGRPQPASLHGRIDATSFTVLEGWAWDEAQPGLPVQLRVRDNGVVIGTVLADMFRPDLAGAGIGNGRHAFRFIIPGGLQTNLAHDLHVERASDGAALPGSPTRIEPGNTTLSPIVEGPRLCGTVDGSAYDRIWGWAWNPASPHEAVSLQVLDNDRVLARFAANRHRPDLQAAGIGQGWHAFEISFPGGLSPLRRHVLRIVQERDGAELTGSPVILEPENFFAPRLEQAVIQAVTALRDPTARSHALAFFAGQTERIRQHDAELSAHRRERIEAQRYSEWAGAGDGSNSMRRTLLVAREVDSHPGQLPALVAMLRRNGYAVSVVAADGLLPSPASNALAEIGATWCGSPFYGSVEEVLRRQGGCFDVVLLCGDDIAQRYASLARHYQPTAKTMHLREGPADFDVEGAEQALASLSHAPVAMDSLPRRAVGANTSQAA